MPTVRHPLINLHMLSSVEVKQFTSLYYSAKQSIRIGRISVQFAVRLPASIPPINPSSCCRSCRRSDACGREPANGAPVQQKSYVSTTGCGSNRDERQRSDGELVRRMEDVVSGADGSCVLRCGRPTFTLLLTPF